MVEAPLPRSERTITSPPPPSWAARRRTLRTGVARRLSAMPATMRRTYSREPPRAVNQRGRLAICSSPWLWQKRIIVAIGKRSICRVGHDQMHATIGRKYQSRNSRE